VSGMGTFVIASYVGSGDDRFKKFTSALISDLQYMLANLLPHCRFIGSEGIEADIPLVYFLFSRKI